MFFPINNVNYSFDFNNNTIQEIDAVAKKSLCMPLPEIGWNTQHNKLIPDIITRKQIPLQAANNNSGPQDATLKPTGVLTRGAQRTILLTENQ